MHELELVRAAAQDVATARSLLRERLETLEAVNRNALDRGIPAVDVAAAGGLSPAEIRNPVGDARR